MEVIRHIDELHPNDFIKVVQIDGPVNKRLTFTGKVLHVSRTEGRYEVYTMDGVVGLGMDMGDFVVEITKLKQRPKGWKKFIKNPKPKTKIIVPQRSKRDLVYDLVKDNPRKKFSGLLTLAKSTIGGDATALSSYIHLGLAKLR